MIYYSIPIFINYHIPFSAAFSPTKTNAIITYYFCKTIYKV